MTDEPMRLRIRQAGSEQDQAEALQDISETLRRLERLLSTYLRMSIGTAVATYEAMPEESRETITPMIAELKQFLRDTDDEVESSSPDR